MKQYPRLLAWLFAVALLVMFAACSDDDGPPPDPIDPNECPPAEALTITLPAGFPEMPNPSSNRLTKQGVALGRALFYDPILSGDSSQACSTCHLQINAFADPRRFSTGIHNIRGTRNAPSIVNPGWQLFGTFWDGRAKDLEAQAKEPVPNPIEMDLPWEIAIERLEAHPTYPDMFCAAFGTRTITRDRVVKAIAQFERTFISVNSRYDKWRRGEEMLTEEEIAGFNIFMSNETGDCFHCHDQNLFSTGTFHNTGLDSVAVDIGRGAVTGPADNGKFKAPTLRNILETAPYMHDGRFASLRKVVEHYNMGFHDGPDVDPLIRARATRRPMRTGEIDTLVVFLETLTDPDFLLNPDLAKPTPTP